MKGPEHCTAFNFKVQFGTSRNKEKSILTGSLQKDLISEASGDI